MADYRTLDDVDIRSKRVLVRVDLNVPMDDGAVSDRTRMERAAPTIRELAAAASRVVVVSHFGRPKGKVDPALSLRPLCAPLATAIGSDVKFIATDWRDTDPALASIDALEPGCTALMENIRFHPGEEANDPALARRLAAFGEIFVNDAFSAAHRAHASTQGVARLLPAVAGRAMQAELTALSDALESPARPVVAVVGGAKISTKLELLGALSSRVDTLIVGGGMANTLLAARGLPVGKSLCEHDLLETARNIVDIAKTNGCDLVLPHDVVVAKALASDADHRTVAVEDVAADDMILDVGSGTVADIVEIFTTARTLVWNGPLGAFETAPFDAGTISTARAAAMLCRQGALLAVAGGGDTVAALKHAGAADGFTYVSTAGGAFLEWLEGKTLPGVCVLQTTQTSRSSELDMERIR